MRKTFIVGIAAILLLVTPVFASGGDLQFAQNSDPRQTENLEQFKRMFSEILGNQSLTPKQREQMEYQRGLREVAELANFFCQNIYPRPSPAECIDKIKHGIGQSADPHSDYMNAEELQKFQEQTAGKFGGVGIELFKTPAGIAPAFVVNTIEGTPAERAGILSGDAITHIVNDNKTVSTLSLKIDEVVKMMRGEPGTTVKLRIARKGVSKELDITITREIIKIAQIEGELIFYGGKTYALIKNKQFGTNNAKELETKYAELEKKAGGKLAGLILSFENNPGGLLHEAYNDIRLFVETKKDIVLTRTNDGIQPYAPLQREILHAKPKDITKGLPILAIVNSGSASASEVVTKALKHFGRATIAGTSETFGKGIVQTVVGTPNGAAIKLTSSEYLIGSLDDWVPVQCTGVGLDITFEYPGVKKRDPITECELSGHVNTMGPMPNAPAHMSIKDANPAHYAASLEMLEAFKQYQLPKMKKQEEQRKALEQQAAPEQQ